jgi:hypothetical protein
MKTTIKLTTASAMTIAPCRGPQGGVIVEIFNKLRKEQLTTLHLTPDQIGAVLFGMEQAAEAAGIAADLRAAA